MPPAPPVPDELRPAFVDLLLALADDKLLLGHRNSDWTGLGPMLEEDIAFSSIAQDAMAHALAVYELAGPLVGRSADQLAFLRTPSEYRCATIVEVNDEFDWGAAIVRQFYCDHFDHERLDRMTSSVYEPLAALARRMRAEQRIHTEHSSGWIRRLGLDAEARTRIQAALDDFAPLARQLFEPVAGQAALPGAGLYPGDDAAMYGTWRDRLREATDAGGLNLALPEALPTLGAGGRTGHHTPELADLLEEMGEVARTEPGASW